MKKRMFMMISIMVALFATLGFVKFRQVEAAIAQASSYQPPPEAVTTITAREEIWQPTLGAIGTVTAVKGVTVSADLPGIVDEIRFDSGDSVRTGDVLVRLDTHQEQAQLAAAEARLDLARLNHERHRGLVETGAVSRAEFDAAAAELRQAEANVREIGATIDRKTIRAPFSGFLGIRQVDLGQYLTSGSPIAPLQALDPIYVDFAIPQQELGRVRVRGSVRVRAEGPRDHELEGTITAINSVVDKSTRNVQVRSILANPGARLRPGMFVKADVPLDASTKVVTIPASAINYAPYGNSVYIVENMTQPNGRTYRGVRQQIVKLGTEQGDLVAIASGLDAGAEVVTSGVFKLRNSVAVQVNNETQPGNDPAPKPEDN